MWRNDKTVVIGRNQNFLEEVDLTYVKARDISVVRRLSGGGAVFHDLGNVNFSIIQKYQDGLFSDYAYFTKPVCEFLRALGIQAELSGRNDLMIGDKKISGNAQTKRNGKILHHGTLLFNADFADLAGSLKPRDLKFASKSVKSVKSRVTNIAAHLQSPLSADQFFDRLYTHFLRNTENMQEYVLTKPDIDHIGHLAETKYRTWDWNCGKSPKYTQEICKKFDFGMVEAKLLVENGCILQAKIYGDFFGLEEVSILEERLHGVRRRREDLRQNLEGIRVSTIISGMSNEDFLDFLI